MTDFSPTLVALHQDSQSGFKLRTACIAAERSVRRSNLDSEQDSQHALKSDTCGSRNVVGSRPL